MSVYCVTGKLGNGKTLVTVGRIRDALRQGLRVATNLDINLKAMFGKDAKNIDFVRIPDKPTLQDFEAIGKGYNGDYDESKFGLLILDECGTWFNSRNWQDKTRKDVNDWMLHARKLRWHLYIIIQDISILDSQARDAICELLVTCRRLDNLRVPFIAPLFKVLTGINLTLPRIHRAKVTYADGLLSDVWTYRGNDLFECYQTDQMFLQNYPHGTHSLLTPWHLYGRHKKPLTVERLMRLTKIYWKRFKSPIALCCGLLFGSTAAIIYDAHEIEQKIVRYELQKHAETEKHPATKPAKNTDQNRAQPSNDAPEKSSDSTPQTKLSAFIEKLSIIGSYNLNDLKVYTFSTGKPDSYLTSTDIAGMGFAIKPMTDCMVELSFNDNKTLVRCQ